MIKYKEVTDKGIIIEQIATRPIVYLDNWALNLFSANHTLRDRFTKLLNDLQGTMAISAIHLLEVVGRSDERQIVCILNFIDSVDGIFIDIEPRKVIERERNFQNTDKSFCLNGPAADLQLLEVLGYPHSPLKPFKISEIFLKLQKKIEGDKNVIKLDFEKNLFPIIKKCRKDKDALLRAKNRFKNKSKRIKTEFPYTEELYSWCIDFIAINETMKMPDKEWRDVAQVIVPTAYCDFVLIDSRWVKFVQATGLKNPEIAKVYSQNELDNFLNDLEKFSE